MGAREGDRAECPSDTIPLMSSRHCTWASAVLLIAAGLVGTGTALRGQQAAPAPKGVGYTIFVRGTPIGREEVRVTVDAKGTTISSEGRFSLPENTLIRKAEVHYTPEWNPDSFALDATVNGGEVSIKTSFQDGTAR